MESFVCDFNAGLGLWACCGKGGKHQQACPKPLHLLCPTHPDSPEILHTIVVFLSETGEDILYVDLHPRHQQLYYVEPPTQQCTSDREKRRGRF